MTKSQRQQYGLGSFVKKIARGAKKVFKSPLGKAAILGGLGMWGMGAGPFSGIKGSGWLSKGAGFLRNKAIGSAIGNMRGAGPLHGVAGGANAFKRGQQGGGIWDWIKANKGKSALLGLGAAGMAMPFFAGGPDEEEEGESWDVTPSSIANIRNMARKRDPSLAFLPPANYVQPGFYAAKGGIANLANGGGPAEAQAEQMLKM